MAAEAPTAPSGAEPSRESARPRKGAPKKAKQGKVAEPEPVLSGRLVLVAALFVAMVVAFRQNSGTKHPRTSLSRNRFPLSGSML